MSTSKKVCPQSTSKRLSNKLQSSPPLQHHAQPWLDMGLEEDGTAQPKGCEPLAHVGHPAELPQIHLTHTGRDASSDRRATRHNFHLCRGNRIYYLQNTPRTKHECGNTSWTLPTDLIGAGGLVHPARVLVVPFSFSLVRHPVGFVHRRHVVAQRDRLHCLVHAAAHGFTHLGGQGQAFHSGRLLRLLMGKEKRVSLQRKWLWLRLHSVKTT